MPEKKKSAEAIKRRVKRKWSCDKRVPSATQASFPVIPKENTATQTCNPPLLSTYSYVPYLGANIISYVPFPPDVIEYEEDADAGDPDFPGMSVSQINEAFRKCFDSDSEDDGDTPQVTTLQVVKLEDLLITSDEIPLELYEGYEGPLEAAFGRGAKTAGLVGN